MRAHTSGMTMCTCTLVYSIKTSPMTAQASLFRWLWYGVQGPWCQNVENLFSREHSLEKHIEPFSDHEILGP
jgi:hypothetical protein